MLKIFPTFFGTPCIICILRKMDTVIGNLWTLNFDRNCKQAQGVSRNGFLRSLETSTHVTSLVTDSNGTLLRLKTSHLHHSIRRSISGERMTRKTMNALCSFDLRADVQPHHIPTNLSEMANWTFTLVSRLSLQTTFDKSKYGKLSKFWMLTLCVPSLYTLNVLSRLVHTRCILLLLMLWLHSKAIHDLLIIIKIYIQDLDFCDNKILFSIKSNFYWKQLILYAKNM